MLNSQEEMHTYLIAVSGYVEVEAFNLDHAYSLALEEVQSNPHQLSTMEVTPSEMPSHLSHVVERVAVKGIKWSQDAISHQELASYLSTPTNLDDIPF